MTTDDPDSDRRLPASRLPDDHRVTAWDSEDPNDLLAELAPYEAVVDAVYDRQPETEAMSPRMKENIAMMWAANEAGRPLSLLGAARKLDALFPVRRLHQTRRSRRE